MTVSGVTDPQAVLKAIEEFDHLGRDTFLDLYGFGRSRKYFLVQGDNEYDSKAILGVAHKYQFGSQLHSADFSGGEQGAVADLRILGFEISVVEKEISPITPSDITAEMDEFHRVGREQYLKNYGGAASGKYFIERAGQRFDAKAILVCAYRGKSGQSWFSHLDIESSELGVAVPLRELGFSIVENIHVENKLQAAFESVLALQSNYQVQKSEEMKVRGKLISNEITDSIKENLRRIRESPRKYEVIALTGSENAGKQAVVADPEWDIQSSNGIGKYAKIPWVRIFDKSLSPRPNQGFYVVALFAADGSSVFLSLNQGATAGDSLKPIDSIAADRLVAEARTVLNGFNWIPIVEMEPYFSNSMDLRDDGLGAAYERTNIVALRYEIGRVPSDHIIQNGLDLLLSMLRYLSHDNAEPLLSPETSEIHHILLRWSATENKGRETIEKHAELLKSRGIVVWGKFGKPIHDARVEKFNKQIDAGIPTYAYLVGGEPRKMLRATLSKVSQRIDSVDRSLIPEYYRDNLTGSETFYTFSEIGDIDFYSQIDDLLFLNSDPRKKVSDSLKSQVTVCFVQHREGNKPVTEVDDIELVKLANYLNWEIPTVKRHLGGVEGDRKQMILSGPPGTGKTFVAMALSRHLVGGDEDRIRLVQFHPSYGYEDFVEGLRPKVIDGGGFEFTNVPGVILQMAKAIHADGKSRVLVIDEINRANIHRVFGELMFLLEYRDHNISLMLEESFSLPDNLIIIGTMNTADRSIRTLDVAMRRRFNFFELLPDTDVLRKIYSQLGYENKLGNKLFSGFESLNEKLKFDIDRHHTIGHSFFVDKIDKIMDRERLRKVWEQQLYPLIEDYFFDRPDKLLEYELTRFWENV